MGKILTPMLIVLVLLLDIYLHWQDAPLYVYVILDIVGIALGLCYGMLLMNKEQRQKV